MEKSIRRLLTIGIVVLVLASGCSRKPARERVDSIKALQIVESVSYTAPLLEVAVDHKFQFEVGTDMAVTLAPMESIKDYIAVYTDPSLTKQVDYDFLIKGNKLTVMPSSTATVAQAQTGSDEVILNEAGKWGSFAHYFLKVNFDFQTGEVLQVPTVTIFTLKNKLTTPEVSFAFSPNESGFSQVVLSWNAIKSADRYAIVRLTYNPGSTAADLVAITDQLSWGSKARDMNQFNGISTTQLLLANYEISDDMQMQSTGKTWWDRTNTNDSRTYGFGVIALGKNKQSLIHWNTQLTVNPADYACDFAEAAFMQSYGSHTFENAAALPMSVPAADCNGKTVNRPVTYLPDTYEVKDGVTQVYGQVYNGSISYRFKLTTPEDNAKQILASKNAQALEVPVTNFAYTRQKTLQRDLKTSSTSYEVTDPIFQGSELSQYLGRNMIYGANIIDLSNFDITSKTYLDDQLMEAMYQNPLISRFQYSYYDVNKKLLYIEYVEVDSVRSAKQEATRQAIRQVSSAIIKPGMSDWDKVFTINQWIIDHTTYNHEASNVLEQYDGYVDSSSYAAYFDANSAYGVFALGTVVCEGYAYAFDLLAEAAGLNSIVVTGNLIDSRNTGFSSHAWNKVQVNGSWVIVDSTNNDMGNTSNSMLMVSDQQASNFLKEDKQFMSDTQISAYAATIGDYEYYRQKGQYTDLSKAVDVLASGLNANGSAIIKVDEHVSLAQANSLFRNQLMTKVNSGYYNSWFFNGVWLVIRN